MRKAVLFAITALSKSATGPCTTNMRYFIAFCFLLAANLAASAQMLGPAETLKRFYAFDRTHSTEFSKRSVNERKLWFSPELYRLFNLELKREADYLKINPSDKPHFGDGLPFRPIDETCNVGTKRLRKKSVVTTVAARARKASVTVTFAFPRPCKTPDKNVYVFSMKRVANRWTIDDLTYDDGTTLVADLKRKDY